MKPQIHPLLDILTSELENIAGQWNGDESGSAEDMASAANDAIEKIEELKELNRHCKAVEKRQSKYPPTSHQ